eukprot:Pgem_evm1s18725
MSMEEYIEKRALPGTFWPNKVSLMLESIKIQKHHEEMVLAEMKHQKEMKEFQEQL